MLDVGHEQQVLDLVDKLRKDAGLTVVSTLHDLTVAGQYAETLVMLDGGEVVASGTPEAVLTVPLIESVYGARVTVVTGGDGHPVVAPLRWRPGEIQGDP
jgi:iron complex transport system ATP-binding protein